MICSAPPYVTGFTCLVCGTSLEYGNRYTCPRCGGEGILDVQYDYAGAAPALKEGIAHRPFDHWRYKELIPVSPDLPAPHLHVGWTPVVQVPRLARLLGIRKLFLKDDSRNPTSSFKDRASSVGVSKAIEFGFDTIACASTGNAASSLAGLAAAAGLTSVIFVPERAPEPKVTQLLIFGATVLKVRGTYEQAFDLCRQACEAFGWYNRNSGTNPFLVEGKKSAGLEIAEQCRGQLPDWVVVSVGDGCTIGGIGKGLREMKLLGFIDRVPRLLGVQAEGAMAVVNAFNDGKDLVPTTAQTIADSIAVGTPRNWRRAIREIKASGGAMIAVTDDEILEAMRTTARLAGIFGEPAGVAGAAGLRKAVEQGVVRNNETALVVITGNGLKDTQSARQAAGQALSIEPNLESLSESLSAESLSAGALPARLTKKPAARP
jgi:threonine synthase